MTVLQFPMHRVRRQSEMTVTILPGDPHLFAIRMMRVTLRMYIAPWLMWEAILMDLEKPRGQ